MSKLKSLNIPAWGSEEALRKEEHVARFLEREYRAVADSPVSLEELGISASTGAMWEETEELIETHYDERIEFFDSFLDSSYRAYSMAFYGKDRKEVLESAFSLEEGQANKFRLICDRIGIRGDEKILNIGCGFGSFERYLLGYYPDVHVTGITPSKVQAAYLQHCLDDPRCILQQENFSLIINDFSLIREDSLELGSFDLIVSIGLLEHVRNMDAFNNKVFELLKPNGKSFHHFIVSKLPLPQLLDSKETLIGDYFPGGRIWPYDEFNRHGGHLQLEGKWFVNGLNYWKTLDEWHRRFWENIDQLSQKLDNVRLSYWNDYFILCKACFRPLSGTAFGNGHYLFRKPG
ncbi:TPA: methyltransferase [Candidatus Micrarchaeota archaeon]|nr:methyltransferase [Candidatus Micrarchaeota archaeon]